MANAQKILDAAKVIESFVDGTCGPYDWDDFLNGSKKDAELQKIREECERVEIDYPACSEHEWCNDEGVRALLAIAARLRRGAACTPSAGQAGPEDQKSKPNKSW
jgi:hypothetical protein